MSEKWNVASLQRKVQAGQYTRQIDNTPVNDEFMMVLRLN